jgi:SAM-dependent methyltransferase
LYQQSSYYSRGEEERDRLEREADDRARRLSALASRRGLHKRLLDVGCGNGIFLVAAQRQGWRVTGVDRSERLASTARERARCEVATGVLEELELSREQFPLVTAWEVLEHARDARAFFSTLVNRVEIHGLLALSTPLSDGLVARVLGRRFPMLSPPEHLSLFSKRSLMALASQHGLHCIGWRAFSNIGPRQIASGIARYGMRCELVELGPLARFAATTFGMATAWGPILVDAFGHGSEMEVVFAKDATRKL